MYATLLDRLCALLVHMNFIYCTRKTYLSSNRLEIHALHAFQDFKYTKIIYLKGRIQFL